jgi:hypothetical protein
MMLEKEFMVLEKGPKRGTGVLGWDCLRAPRMRSGPQVLRVACDLPGFLVSNLTKAIKPANLAQ